MLEEEAISKEREIFGARTCSRTVQY